MSSTREHEVGASAGAESLRTEVARLNRVVQVLMDRSERVTGEALSEYGQFQRRIVLGEIVRQRTEELHMALSENETITRRLKVSEARFRGLAEQSLVGIAVVDESGFLYVNGHFSDTLGYSQSELAALPPLHTVADTDRRLFADHLRTCQKGEPQEALLAYEGCKKDGSSVDLELSSSRMAPGDDETGLILVVKDVTARKQAERKVKALNDRLAELAVRDPLTGLYNRRFMEASLEREIVAAARNGTPLSVVIGDIDHFKSVNDTHGHQAGDEVLQTVSSLFRELCRKSDIACRYGGEEFLIVFPGMPVGLAADWAERARQSVSETEIVVGSSELHITASFGVAGFPAQGKTWQEVIGAADAALYSAKSGGRDQVRRAPFPISVCEDTSRQAKVQESGRTSSDSGLLSASACEMKA
jgi:diguanylate cyclase (GGDEF)-like protein/PAS domain S-box-containing protein